MILTNNRSKRANRIQRYLGIAFLGNQVLEFFFCNGGLLKLPLTPLLEIILVMLSPLDDERLEKKEIWHMRRQVPS